jgi:hypothetical protein
MGNETSKSTIENQQLIMQLQQQILNNQRGPTQQQPLPSYNQMQQQPRLQPRLPPRMPNINSINPNAHENISITNILQNKELLHKIDGNPVAKRKLLEKLLNEHRHVMTTHQINKITMLLNNLPPLQNDNNTPRYTNPQSIGLHHNSASLEYGTGFNQGTTPQDLNNRQLQTTQQYNDVTLLKEHYKSEEDAEEAAFKREEKRRHAEFLEKQRQRRTQYQSKLIELDKNNIDALKIFSLKANYTLDELKSAYKKLAMKSHPDKPGGNKEQFQLVTKCYMSLLEKYKNRESDKQFTDLRNGSKAYLEDQSKDGYRAKHMDKDKFDVKLFNKIYEDNKLWESNDDGYDDFMKKDNDTDPPVEVFGNKFNINVFNSTFENYKDKATGQNNMQIQQFREPKELVSCGTGFTEIDIYSKKIEDFSKPLPITGIGNKNELAYTDLKTAYTSRGAFIDPSKVEYKTYKSIDELKRDRGNIKYDMTPEQLAEYEHRKQMEMQEEEIRQSRIRERDTVITKTYGKLHERMLGYRANAPS